MTAQEIPDKEWFGVEEAAGIVGVSVASVRRCLGRMEDEKPLIPHRRVGLGDRAPVEIHRVGIDKLFEIYPADREFYRDSQSSASRA